MAEVVDDFETLGYNHPIDFKQLAGADKDFRDCLASNGWTFDFKNADHLRCLTKALLLRDFNLHLHLPHNRLCPPVPIRWLYVQWIRNLIRTTNPQTTARMTVAGLDIGVGASCIYPLLACASQTKWSMYGTDIDETNYQNALHNVVVNEFDNRIKLLKTVEDGPLIPLDALQVQKLDFTMCNPPFFATKEEATATFLKDQQPFAACTGADVEMITPGGEVSYVKRMISESTKLRERVQWYTVQLGKLSSLHAIVQELKDTENCNWVVNVLQPSGQTVRWVVGWSWMVWRAPDHIARHKSLVGTHLQMEPQEQVLCDSLTANVYPVILEAIEGLPLYFAITEEFIKDNDMEVGTVEIRMNSAVWSRSERRKRQREEQQDEGKVLSKNGSNVNRTEEFTTWITVKVQKSLDSARTAPKYAAVARWAKGDSRAIFESFCGMLKARINAIRS